MSKSTTITRSRERTVFSNNEYRIAKVSDLLISSAKSRTSNHDSVNDFLRIHGNMDLEKVAEKWPKANTGKKYRDIYPHLPDSVLNVIRDTHNILYSRNYSRNWYKNNISPTAHKVSKKTKVEKIDSSEVLTLGLTKEEFFKLLLNKNVSTEFALSINSSRVLNVTVEAQIED